MLKLLGRLMLVLAVCFGLGTAQPAEAALTRENVAFVVVDSHNLVERQTEAEWRSVVKWAYHFPYYRFTEGWVERSLALSLQRPGLGPSRAELAELASKHDLAALVLARVHSLDERIVHRCCGGWWDADRDDTYVELDVDVDLYVYKTKTDKLLKKHVRERKLAELGNYDSPAETVKWALSDIVNKMENRPLIR